MIEIIYEKGLAVLLDASGGKVASYTESEIQKQIELFRDASEKNNLLITTFELQKAEMRASLNA